jgi:signal transduction histidine kinase/DNA-binding NarL/FixJ family response regulator/streptogramin lyase
MILLLVYVSSFGQELQFRHLSIEQGLSQNMTTTICQDYKGFMWFGTKDGLNRYDGYSFKIYKADTFDENSIPDNYITATFEDAYHNLWIGTMYGGLLLYDREKDSFIKINQKNFPARAKYISSITGTPQTGLIIAFLSGHVVRVTAIQKEKPTTQSIFYSSTLVVQKAGELQIPVKAILAPDGLLWVSGKNGYRIYDPITEKQLDHYRSYPTYVQEYNKLVPTSRRRDDSLSPLLTSVQDLKWDEDGIFWMNSFMGLYAFDPKRKEFTLYQFSSSLYAVLPLQGQSGEKKILVDSYGDKLLQLNPLTGQVKKIDLNRPNNQEILDVRFSVMEKTRDGSIWLGSNGRGIFFSHPYLSLFSKGKLVFSQHDNFISNSLYTLFQQKSPTTGHEQILFSTLNVFGQLDIAPDGKITSFIENNLRTRCIIQDEPEGKVWIGSPMGLIHYDPDTRKVDLKVPMKDSMIMSIYRDSTGIIWFSTYSNLFSFDPVLNKLKKFPFLSESNDRMVTMHYSTIQPDLDGSLWLGTSIGLLHFSPHTERYIHVYKSNPQIPHSLSSNEVKCIYIDPDPSSHFVWVGTTTGLNRLDKKTGHFEHFTTEDGLPNNTVYGILDDEKGNMWLSSNRGISLFDPKRKSFINFDVENGLQSNEFNTGAYFKSKNGELFFGGINGYNRFYPQNVRIQMHKTPIVISQVQQVGAGKKEATYFSEIKDNVLRHDQNNISIDLASLDYLASDRINYAYRIINHDTAWNNIGNNRNILLTNLSPGKYVFQGRGTDGLGQWNDQWVEMTFVIVPPWWRSPYAHLFYTCIILLSIYGFWKRYKYRMMLQQSMENERRQAQDVMALNQIKSRFLANITHEFRTPLTLINGHLEQLEENDSSISKETRYREMKQNSHHLLGLINQLMDLSKIESGAYKIRYRTKDLVQELQMIVANFAAYSMQKQITLEFEPCAQVLCASKKFTYDEGVVQTIVSNLLSNACKFTPQYGFIQVTLAYESQDSEVKITVSDTGIGISKDDLNHIFDRFYQSDDSSGRQFGGSGIGLSLVKELAILHGGDVAVESEPTVGSRFTITLKEGPRESNSTDIQEVLPNVPAHTEWEEVVGAENETTVPTILIAEDHLELRRFISESLGNHYQYIEVGSGIEALDLAISQIPDLVISDVMMPGMDGLELCKEIKNHDVTSHIPIILLTARADSEDKLAGLKNGADDYLTKPFSVQELRFRVKNILHSRKVLQKRYQTSLPQALKDKSIENTYIVKVEGLIRSNTTDAAFGVEKLAQILMLSTAQLNRKIKAITGQTTVLFIQNVKMQMALELLMQGEKNIAEIAFEVGFENPGYFSKVFKKHFGFSPSERERLKDYKVNVL